jgi:hypothetical protein
MRRIFLTVVKDNLFILQFRNSENRAAFFHEGCQERRQNVTERLGQTSKQPWGISGLLWAG